MTLFPLRRLALPAVLAAAVAPLEDAAGDPAFALPGDDAATADFSPRRRREYRAVRHLARRLLAESGGDAATGLRNDGAGMPLWPSGFTGSLSHGKTQVLAAVARSAAVRAVGVDIESIGRVRPALFERIATPEEQSFAAGLEPERRELFHTLVFSAKEAYYKLIAHAFGATERWRDAQLAVDFTAETVHLTGRHTAVGGRFFRLDAENMLAAVLWLAAKEEP